MTKRSTAALSTLTIPELPTATDVIDLLSGHVADMVVESFVNAGTDPTCAQFGAAFGRAFDAALPVFLARIAKVRPRLAAQIRSDFTVEQESRTA